MISTYIKELLQKHNRVIIPDLGAFLRKNENPDSVYFNEFLRFNDGLLVDFLSEKESLDKIESAKRIKGYVADINKNLADKQPVELKGIGTLQIDSNDKIQLKVELFKVYTAEEMELPVKKSKKNSESQKTSATQNKEEIVIPIPQPIEEIKQEAVKQSIIEKPFKVEKQEEVIPKETTTKQPIKLLSEDMSKFEKSPSSKPAPANITTNYKEKSSSNKGWLWIIIVLALILLVLAWFFIIKPRLNSATDQNNILKPEVETISVTPKPEISVPNDKPVLADKKYYVVAGCFAMESNADKLVKTLTAQGFSSEKFAKIQELYFVSIGSFNEKSVAFKELNKLVNQGYVDCWVKFY